MQGNNQIDYFNGDYDNVASDDETEGTLDADIAALLDSVEIPDAPTWIEVAPNAEVSGKRIPQLKYTREAEIAKDHGVIVWDESDHMFMHFHSAQALETYILATPMANRTFHERIYAAAPQRLRFDIDNKACSLTLEDLYGFVDVVVATFNAIYPMSRIGFDDVMMCDSTLLPVKQSVHAIVKSYHVVNNHEAANFAKLVCEKLPVHVHECIDLGIYKSATGLRLPYCTKPNVNRPKLLPLHTAFTDVLITECSQTYELPPIAPQVPVQIEFTNITDMNEVLQAINPDMLAGLKYRNTRNGFINFNRVAPSACPISGEMHHIDNTLYAFVANNSVYIKCHHCGGPKLCGVINGEVNDKDLKANCELKPKITRTGMLQALINAPIELRQLTADSYNTYESQYMQEYEDVATLGVQAQMGAGKSVQLSEVLRGLDDNKVVRAVSFRRSFTEEMKTTYRLKSYMDITGDITHNHRKVIVQCESLRRVLPAPCDLLIIDEIESVLDQFYAKTMRDYNTCWMVFKYLVKNSARVIFMDAILSQRSIDIIKEIRCGPVHLHTNTTRPISDSTHYITQEDTIAIKRLYSALREGRRVVIPTNSNKMARKLHLMLTGDFPEKKIALYTKETPSEVKADHFSRVNEVWVGHDVLIYTPTILAGVSFTEKWYDLCVCFWYDTSCVVGACLQMMRRVRDISTREYIHTVCNTGNSLPETPESVKAHIECKYENIRSQYVPIAGEIQPDGRIKYAAGVDFNAFVSYLANVNASKNQFLQVFVNELKLMGAKLIAFGGAKDDETKQKINQAGQQIKSEDAAVIVAAKEIDDDEYGRLEARGDALTGDEINALRKYNLREWYKYDGDMDEKWVVGYGSRALMQQFRNRRDLKGFGDMVPHEVLNGIRNGFVHEIMERRELNVDHTHDLAAEIATNRIERHRIAQRMLSHCGLNLDSPPDMLIRREDLLAGLSRFDIAPDYVCNVFGVKKVDLPSSDDKKFFSSMLRFVNGKLESQYGISIVSIDKKQKKYHLTDGLKAMFNGTDQPVL